MKRSGVFLQYIIFKAYLDVRNISVTADGYNADCVRRFLFLLKSMFFLNLPLVDM
jgi:hypothetical protein